ncbi:MAG: NAD kinase [Prolixibacteraceae bacterium]|nr:NAD kinase [Prolixibacteraceae bacterium]
MKVAIYGTEVKEAYLPVYQRIFHFFSSHAVELVLFETIQQGLSSYDFPEALQYPVFNLDSKVLEQPDFILSIGGDGTFLSAISFALAVDAPIAGINCGRLGFLADISSDNLEESLNQLLVGDYHIENRSLLRIVSPDQLFSAFNYAANEITVHKLDNSSMIKIDTYINGEFLAGYWADGLIIATPTGSTAYSLSVGGPIVMPDLAGLIITPIAPHNLTVRPMVVPDNVLIELHIEGRGNQYLVSSDHRSIPLDFSIPLSISIADLYVKIIKINGLSFYSTLRNKLMWGADKRN